MGICPVDPQPIARFLSATAMLRARGHWASFISGLTSDRGAPQTHRAHFINSDSDERLHGRLKTPAHLPDTHPPSLIGELREGRGRSGKGSFIQGSVSWLGPGLLEGQGPAEGKGARSASCAGATPTGHTPGPRLTWLLPHLGGSDVWASEQLRQFNHTIVFF